MALVPPPRPRRSLALTAAGLAFLAAAPWGTAAASDRGGRIELTTTATLYGVGVGVWTSVSNDLSPRPAAWISAGLGGGALYGTWTLAEARGMDTANVQYIETGAGWLAVDTVLAAAAIDMEETGIVWSGIGAAAVGGGLTYATYPHVTLSTGQLSLINTGGIFGPAAGLLLGATLHLGDGEHLPRDLLVLNLLGLGTGIGLTRRYDPTRDQVLYLDGAMLAGGLCGALVGTMVAVGVDAWEPITGAAVLGMGAGAVISLNSTGFDRAGRKGRKTTGTTQPTLVMPL